MLRSKPQDCTAQGLVLRTSAATSANARCSRLSPSIWERTEPAGRSSAAATVPRHAARRNFSHRLRRMSGAASTGRVVFAKAAPDNLLDQSPVAVGASEQD